MMCWLTILVLSGLGKKTEVRNNDIHIMRLDEEGLSDKGMEEVHS